MHLENLSVASLTEELRARRAPATVVNVWATWCLPCREEFPDLLRVAREYRARGVRLVLISADFPDRRAEVVRFLAGQGVDFPSYLKDGPDMEFIDALSPQWSGALPATFIFGDGGELRWFVEGQVHYETLRDALSRILDEERSS